MSTTTDSDDDDQIHKYDVLRPGDEIPWFGEMVEVVNRTTTDEWPDDIPEHGRPHSAQPPEASDDTPYVILTLDYERDDGELLRHCASSLVFGLDTQFEESGLPAVRAEATASIGVDPTIRVQTPATGNNPLQPHDARVLAAFLRGVSDFAPLYALLGGVDSEADVEAVADALDRAASVREIGMRLGDDE